jgi:hypothetical protein
MMTSRRILLCASPLLLLLATEAHGAGGAHVVDDAAIEDPGTCNLETWTSAMGKGSALLTASAACTPRRFPWLQAGGWMQRTWTRSGDDTLAGPAIKAAALPLGPGISIALSAWGGWSLGLHRLEAAGASIPLTVELGSGVTLNLNAGWEWSRTGDRHKAIVGAQIDWSVSEHLSLMAEGFGQIGAGAGYQAGIRWMPARWIDVDLLVGRLSDGTARHAATMGVTVRY